MSSKKSDKIINKLNSTYIDKLNELPHSYFKKLRINGRRGTQKESNSLLIKITRKKLSSNNSNDCIKNNETCQTYYFLKEHNSHTIKMPNKALIDSVEKALFNKSYRLCSKIVANGYIKENYYSNNVSFILFQKNENTRLKGNENNWTNINNNNNNNSNNMSKISIMVTGIVFLNELPKKDLYLSLICCEKGLGTPLMELVESVGKILKYKRIVLKSIDEPIKFYIKKGYKFMKGKQSVVVPKGIAITSIELDKSEIDGTYESKNGSLMNRKNVLRIYGTGSKRSKRINNARTKIISTRRIYSLKKGKESEDGITMFKKL